MKTTTCGNCGTEHDNGKPCPMCNAGTTPAHTPGPFINNGLYIKQKSSGRTLATIQKDESRRGDVIGNLALFTASPELLELLQKLADYHDVRTFAELPRPELDQAMAEARAIIAKAKGQ